MPTRWKPPPSYRSIRRPRAELDPRRARINEMNSIYARYGGVPPQWPARAAKYLAKMKAGIGLDEDFPSKFPSKFPKTTSPGDKWIRRPRGEGWMTEPARSKKAYYAGTMRKVWRGPRGGHFVKVRGNKRYLRRK